MSRGVNKVFLLGHLGQNPQRRELPSGTPVCNATLATNDAWRDRDTSEQRQRTEWHRLVFFDRLAEVVCLYLEKGSQVHIEGSLRSRKWQDPNGQDRYTTEVVVTELQMLGGGSEPNTLPNDGPAQSKDTPAAVQLAKLKAAVGQPTPAKKAGGRHKTKAGKTPVVVNDDIDWDDVPF